MKKILIISYHSLPFDVIASYRANAYLKHFKSFGFQSTLLTHYVGMPEKNNVTIEEYDYGAVIRVPIKRSILGRVTAILESVPVINKLSILCRWIGRYLDTRPEDINSYFSLKSYCFSELEIGQFDMVLGIFSPHHHLRLCYDIHKKFKIPYVLDFRDLWDNRVMHRDYKPTIIERLQDSLTKKAWIKWSKNARFFSIISEPYRDYLESIINKKGFVIMNGFDEEAFSFSGSKKSQERFEIVYGGSLYEHQKLDIFLQGCLKFITDESPENFKVRFVGSDRNVIARSRLSGFMHNPKERILEVLPEKHSEVTRRIPKEEALGIFQNASLLLYLSMPEAPGTYLGKIFDYLGSQRNILMVPDDRGEIGDLIKRTNNGTICNTPDEVFGTLSKSYKEWKSTGSLNFMGISHEIKKYTRRVQVESLADRLTNTLNH